MAGENGNQEEVKFNRGGEEVTLYKSADRIAVMLRNTKAIDHLPTGLMQKAGVPRSVRYIGTFPGNRYGIYWCPSGERENVMKRLRAQKGQVRYVSHVYHRSGDGSCPNDEIGLDDKVFVEFIDKPDDKTIREVQKRFGLRAIWRLPQKPEGVVFQLTAAAERNPITISKNLCKIEYCKKAEPCLNDIKQGRAVPFDLSFGQQWHLLNVGQEDGIPGADCNAVEAWDYTWGDPDIVVALIDDGFDLTHPDLGDPGKVRHPYDATQGDSDPSPYYFTGSHGTSCAGIAIAARGGGYTIGVAPDCGFMPIRHAGRIGDYEEALAFYHAYINGADVISCSWGVQDRHGQETWPMSQLVRLMIDICVTHGRNGRGIPIFFPAGNGNESLEYDGYANNSAVITVAASTNEDRKAWYSDYGENVWVCAPSGGGTADITTTDRTGTAGYSYDSDYTSSFDGTSASVPMVAGVAALMLSKNRNLTVQQIKEILKNTAVKIQENPSSSFSDYWGKPYTDEYVDGHSVVYGWGRVDAGAAVRMAIDYGSRGGGSSPG